ncbi:UPF0029-domain-containing protein [Lophiostoma macrostomum CBS 122681]|uniref:UPF0029-domain-containing protein n=1 Tax=Lophiostoma macrostomum CBS 122681 TaxID=1314788 RepID=A0A6A6TAW1_9PLEO|nr:UPF0029-domain-containing protein [Lophiostoma macrostomum CBS 122681]
MTTAENESLTDEITSINSIYASDTLSVLSPPSSSSSSFLCSLRLPALPSITIRLEVPQNYPDTPPSILGTQSVGDDVPKGAGNQIVTLVRDVLAQVYRPGEPSIFDLLEDVREAIEKAEDQDISSLNPNNEVEHEQDHSQQPPTSHLQEDIGPEPPWIIAPPTTEKKSVFLARVAPVSSPAQAKSYIQHLLSTDKKAARATHNITAWRIHGLNGATYQDCDDDGETAAGGRVLHLMQLMDVWDVMIVVTRWYGGVLLGPDRFRIINSAARDAL